MQYIVPKNQNKAQKSALSVLLPSKCVVEVVFAKCLVAVRIIMRHSTVDTDLEPIVIK